MIDISIENSTLTLKDILKQLKAIVSKGQFLIVKENLTHVDELTVRIVRLLTDPASQYFSAEAKLFIGSVHISLADVVRIMKKRGVNLSRSGCENRILLNAKKFVDDFGFEAVTILMTENQSMISKAKLDVIELRLLKLETGVDYTCNALDKLLKKHNINAINFNEFENTTEVSQEQLDEFIRLIKPYTVKGIAELEKKLNEFNHLLWHFRRSMLDGSDPQMVNYILRNIV